MLDFLIPSRSIGQAEFEMEHPVRPDRNHHVGGRSFYFFDLDDNILHLPTPLYLFHRITGEEVAVTTQEFATIHDRLGKSDPWVDYEVRLCDLTGSFRRFRNFDFGAISKILGKRQPLVEDLLLALNEKPAEEWKGPSWNFFWHAVHNSRPTAIITARGHSPDTIRDSIRLLVRRGFLTKEPNYLGIFPVSHPPTRKDLGDHEFGWSTAQLKKNAIAKSVQKAFETYGHNTGHQFGMSDDDPKNVALVIEAMKELKFQFPENSFFVIDTHGGRVLKQEVTQNGVQELELSQGDQLNLFG
jgi:hypothetical protein